MRRPWPALVRSATAKKKKKIHPRHSELLWCVLYMAPDNGNASLYCVSPQVYKTTKVKEQLWPNFAAFTTDTKIFTLLMSRCVRAPYASASIHSQLKPEHSYRNLCINLHLFFRSGFDPLTLLAGLAFLAFLLQTLHALLYRQTTNVSSVGLARTISDSMSDIEHRVKAALDKYVSSLNIFTVSRW